MLTVLELDQVSPSSGMLLVWGWVPDPLVQEGSMVPASHLVSPTSHPDVLLGAAGWQLGQSHWGTRGFPPFFSRQLGTGRDPPSLGDPECNNTAQMRGFLLWRVTGLATAPPECSELQVSVFQRCRRAGVRSGG